MLPIMATRGIVALARLAVPRPGVDGEGAWNLTEIGAADSTPRHGPRSPEDFVDGANVRSPRGKVMRENSRQSGGTQASGSPRAPPSPRSASRGRNKENGKGKGSGNGASRGRKPPNKNADNHIADDKESNTPTSASSSSTATRSIEQGQPGLRLMSQWALIITCVNSTLVCAGFPPGSTSGVLRSAASGCLPYMLAACQVFFAITAWVFEVELSCLGRLCFLNSYQNFLLQNAPFLAELGARGFLYLLQGVIWLLFVSPDEPQHLVICLWLAVVASFQFCAHYNFMSRRVVNKTYAVQLALFPGEVEVADDWDVLLL